MLHQSKISLKLIPGRECGNCTKCCEGPLDGIPNRGPGTPCVYVSLGKGCTIHDMRPKLCKSFQCGWRTEEKIPLEMKPSLTNYIPYLKYVNDIPYYFFVPAPDKMNQMEIKLLKAWADAAEINVGWEEDGVDKYYGSQEFLESLNTISSTDPYAIVIDRI